MAKLEKLESLGFRTVDCEKALLIYKGDVSQAASWLAEYATPACDIVESEENKNNDISMTIGAIVVSIIYYNLSQQHE